MCKRVERLLDTFEEQYLVVVRAGFWRKLVLLLLEMGVRVLGCWRWVPMRWWRRLPLVCCERWGLGLWFVIMFSFLGLE